MYCFVNVYHSDLSSIWLQNYRADWQPAISCIQLHQTDATDKVPQSSHGLCAEYRPVQHSSGLFADHWPPLSIPSDILRIRILRSPSPKFVLPSALSSGTERDISCVNQHPNIQWTPADLNLVYICVAMINLRFSLMPLISAYLCTVDRKFTGQPGTYTPAISRSACVLVGWVLVGGASFLTTP